MTSVQIILEQLYNIHNEEYVSFEINFFYKMFYYTLRVIVNALFVGYIQCKTLVWLHGLKKISVKSEFRGFPHTFFKWIVRGVVVFLEWRRVNRLFMVLKYSHTKPCCVQLSTEKYITGHPVQRAFRTLMGSRGSLVFHSTFLIHFQT